MKNKSAWYAPLEAQYRNIKNAMPLSRFVSIEAILHLLWEIEPSADPRKAYLLFTQYQIIGAQACTPMDHILQQTRYTLEACRSKKYWQDELRAYRDTRYQAVRAFCFVEQGSTVSFAPADDGYPYSYENRLEEWESFWSEDTGPEKQPVYAKAGLCAYTYTNTANSNVELVQVQLETDGTPAAEPPRSGKGPRAPITISMDEILQTAKQMAEICPGDPCYTILQSNTLKQVIGTSVCETQQFAIREVVNIVGMVGTGKTTLIKVLSFWCHQNGCRMSIVVDTVASVLHLQKYFSDLGIASSPLIGRSERLRYMHQVANPKETCLLPEFSRYLTPICLIDGMDEQHENAISFGREPCYTLQQDDDCLCPYFHTCPGTRMLRECYTASVVITTVAGFSEARVGPLREPFLQTVMQDMDIVVFDESDRTQTMLDQTFMPKTSFDEYIQRSADEHSAYRRLHSRERESKPARQNYAELQNQATAVLSSILRSLHCELGTWNRITQGDPFSALTLLEDLYERENAFQIPRKVYRAIYDLIDTRDVPDKQLDTLRIALVFSCQRTNEQFFDLAYDQWLAELGSAFPRPQTERLQRIQDSRIKLILRLIYFDHFIRDLNDAYEDCHEVSHGQNELFGFLQTRFRQQQRLLPSALCGNLFGLKKTDEEDILLFRQFAFGRSLMKDLPYLRTDIHGRPTGPHVILLSGSSWAEGSYTYHINRPVNYILETDHEKRMFLERTRFFESGFVQRVSGAGPDNRLNALCEITRSSVGMIVREYERQAGKLLLITNSYAQAEKIQPVLEKALRQENCPARVCRMVADTDKSTPGTLRRGDAGCFAQMPEEILIAPAMAVERGHNIVDETGHSALSAVFFLVRPMAVPDDIQQMGSKLNGLAEARCKREPGESPFAYNARLQQFCMQQWARMNKNKAFGLADLDDAERKDIVATLFVLILQIFGRLARVTDTAKPEPHVYFVDGAFRAREGKPDDFDCLSELGRYPDTLMTHKASAEIAKALYEPFYKAYRKDIPYEQKQ